MSKLSVGKYYVSYEIYDMLPAHLKERFREWMSDSLDGHGCNGYLTMLDYEEFNEEIHDEDERERLLEQKELFDAVIALGAEEDEAGLGINIQIVW